MKEWESLKELVSLVGTPGDEEEVANFLFPVFSSFGECQKTVTGDLWCVRRNPGAPRVVVTAHMDSPGFILKRILPSGQLEFIPLGGISPERVPLCSVKLRTSKGYWQGVLSWNGEREAGLRFIGEFGFSSKEEAEEWGVQLGDRAAFLEEVREMANGYVMAPHLDNRLGCALLLALCEDLKGEKLSVELYLAATTEEEMTSRGALTLARVIKPQVVICLDATYGEAPVELGKGPVLTVSDRSVLLSLSERDKILELAEKAQVPLQLEVYNYGATDARAFHHSPTECRVFSLLVPTLHNHTPFEIMSVKDWEKAKELLRYWLLHFKEYEEVF